MKARADARMRRVSRKSVRVSDSAGATRSLAWRRRCAPLLGEAKDLLLRCTWRAGQGPAKKLAKRSQSTPCDLASG
jgi:hypothetical protein